ncbi:hypothetical protein BB559_002993 [Furculomyces boomerangus]|uniref:Uncharacterized protein n=2 Tax=Harpellales TaxID=61421 RepID=A0A2T9YQ57_9FUNG|nr:hypothetical protein BB559_002993 [Furculomyces boomerangus]PVZ99058.1 hypothetical protein BB558_004934 [Smittium angustum]
MSSQSQPNNPLTSVSNSRILTLNQDYGFKFTTLLLVKEQQNLIFRRLKTAQPSNLPVLPITVLVLWGHAFSAIAKSSIKNYQTPSSNHKYIKNSYLKARPFSSKPRKSRSSTLNSSFYNFTLSNSATYSNLSVRKFHSLPNHFNALSFPKSESASSIIDFDTELPATHELSLSGKNSDFSEDLNHINFFESKSLNNTNTNQKDFQKKTEFRIEDELKAESISNDISMDYKGLLIAVDDTLPYFHYLDNILIHKIVKALYLRKNYTKIYRIFKILYLELANFSDTPIHKYIIPSLFAIQKSTEALELCDRILGSPVQTLENKLNACKTTIYSLLEISQFEMALKRFENYLNTLRQNNIDSKNQHFVNESIQILRFFFSSSDIEICKKALLLYENALSEANTAKPYTILLLEHPELYKKNKLVLYQVITSGLDLTSPTFTLMISYAGKTNDTEFLAFILSKLINAKEVKISDILVSAIIKAIADLGFHNLALDTYKSIRKHTLVEKIRSESKMTSISNIGFSNYFKQYRNNSSLNSPYPYQTKFDFVLPENTYKSETVLYQNINKLLEECLNPQLFDIRLTLYTTASMISFAGQIGNYSLLQYIWNDYLHMINTFKIYEFDMSVVYSYCKSLLLCNKMPENIDSISEQLKKRSIMPTKQFKIKLSKYRKYGSKKPTKANTAH